MPNGDNMDSLPRQSWDSRYEWKIVALLSFGFGLVSVDRFLLMPLFPTIVHDLHFDYSDLGIIAGALSFTWGAAAFLTGRLSDRFGHRKVLIPAMITFTAIVGVSGLASGVLSLVMLRGCMGIAEGAFAPACITATLKASKPSRHGRNVGLQQAASPLMGMCATPIIVTHLLRYTSWHWIFAIVSLPGFFVCYLLYRVLRDIKSSPTPGVSEITASEHVERPVRASLRYRNIPLNMIGMMCWITVVGTVGAFFPSYLSEHLNLGVRDMGFVLSATGLGGCIGTIVMPTLSDRIGRRPVMILSVLGAMVSLYCFANTGSDQEYLFVELFGAIFFIFSAITLTVGPISSESVPSHLMTTATGMVIGAGEIIGGGIAPIVCGFVIRSLGIQAAPLFALLPLCLGLVVVLALRESAPEKQALSIAQHAP